LGPAKLSRFLDHQESSLSKRTVANRLNAQKSTGPKTPEGKRKSSLNAETHGLLSKIILADCDTEGRQEFAVCSPTYTKPGPLLMW
jgi:hypothetical protein